MDLKGTIHIVNLPEARRPRFLVIPEGKGWPIANPFLLTVEGLKGEYITLGQAEGILALRSNNPTIRGER